MIDRILNFLEITAGSVHFFFHSTNRTKRYHVKEKCETGRIVGNLGSQYCYIGHYAIAEFELLP